MHFSNFWCKKCTWEKCTWEKYMGVLADARQGHHKQVQGGAALPLVLWPQGMQLMKERDCQQASNPVPAKQECVGTRLDRRQTVGTSPYIKNQSLHQQYINIPLHQQCINIPLHQQYINIPLYQQYINNAIDSVLLCTPEPLTRRWPCCNLMV